MDEWQRMETSPTDGTVFDVLCVSEAGIEIVVPELKWARRPIGKGLILWGTNNPLSSYLSPIGWKPRVSKGNVADGENT